MSYKKQREFLEIAKSAKSFDELIERSGMTPSAVQKMAVKLGVVVPRIVAKHKWLTEK